MDQMDGPEIQNIVGGIPREVNPGKGSMTVHWSVPFLTSRRHCVSMEKASGIGRQILMKKKDQELRVAPDPILLTGATGYIGGCLLPVLKREGFQVRCLARDPGKMRAAGPGTQVTKGDLLDPDGLPAAFQGIRTAYYLVHSMDARGSFEDRDRRAAANFARAARIAGVKRIIYLGGLGKEDESLSPHLRSRHEVGSVLRQAGVPVLEFRASIIIGAGSLSFEMIRTLVERLPLMVTPRWVSTAAQPIAVKDVVAYLTAGLRIPLFRSRIFEIGGADRVSYGEIMRIYGCLRGLRVRMIPLPVLTPVLSSLWLGLVTPLYARIGRRLIEGIANSTVIRDQSAADFFAIRPLGIKEAIRQAITDKDRWLSCRSWARLVADRANETAGTRMNTGHLHFDTRSVVVERSSESAFIPLRRIGGETGWYALNWMWRVRGGIDRLTGGMGMRRGRLHPDRLNVGDPVDFWRVEEIEMNRRLRLAADMKLPGRAWLEFEILEKEPGAAIFQTLVFDPVGWRGRIYWYALLPIRRIVLGRMLRGIARESRCF